MTRRTGNMPTVQLIVGDVILEHGRRWRVAKYPVPELLPDGRTHWIVAVDAMDGGDLPHSFQSVSFGKYNNLEWLVEF